MKKIYKPFFLIFSGIVIGFIVTIYLVMTSLNIESKPEPINVSDVKVAKIIEEARYAHITKDPSIANMICTHIKETDTSYVIEFSFVCESIKVELLFGAIVHHQVTTCGPKAIEVKKKDLLIKR